MVGGVGLWFNMCFAKCVIHGTLGHWGLVALVVCMCAFRMLAWIMFIFSAITIVPITFVVVIIISLTTLDTFTTVATLAGNRPVAGCPRARAPSARSAPGTRPGAFLIWTSAVKSWTKATTTSATFSDRA